MDIAKRYGGLQILFAGKAHPEDHVGTDNIKEILNIIDSLEEHRHHLRAVFLENYDTYVAKLLISGVDVWLNNPLPPFEASGTSGMKAVLNGVLQLSTMDGWVVEAADNEIGEIFGHRPTNGEIGREMDLRLREDSDSLCDKLELMVQDYCEVERAQPGGRARVPVDRPHDPLHRGGQLLQHLSDGCPVQPERLAHGARQLPGVFLTPSGR